MNNTQIAVIDTSVEDYQVLENAAREAGMDVILLSGQGDGVAELGAALKGRSGIDALHILSHGSNGQLILGDSVLNSDSLDDYSDELESIRQSLTEEGDLLLYGCNIASDEFGIEFLGSLGHLTGADIASSTDATGSLTEKTNWVLEFAQGAVETNPLKVEAWTASLAVGQYILGDGSGGGGGGHGSLTGKNGGAGGGGDDTLTGTVSNDVIYGDGSGGGGSSGSHLGNSGGQGGAGGGGSDTISGGDGNDVIFGDGFSGFNGGSGWPGHGGKGGLGGGGGGAGIYDPSSDGGVGGLGAGSGICYREGVSGSTSPQPLVAGFGNAGGDYFSTGSGGNSATDIDTHTGNGGSRGGGGGFGGAAGGAYDSSGASGDTNQHFYNDTTGAIRDYFTDAVLRDVLTNYPSYGAGADTIDGGGGSDELFGLGGNDTFVFDLSTAGAADTDRVWDFSKGDNLQLKDALGNTLDNTALQTLYASKSMVDADGDSASDDLQMVLSGSGKQITIQLINTSALQIGNDNFIYPNQSPNFGSNQTLATVNEDTSSPAGTTVNSLFNATYSDSDNDNFAGIAIATNAANSTTEGAWQYTTDGGSNWYNIGTPSTSAALLIQDNGNNTLLRFVPVANYNGTPGSLTVYAVDNSLSTSWTSGNSTQSFDTTTDDGTSKVSAAGISLSTSITSINDTPVFTGLDGTPAFTEGGSAVILDSNVVIADSELDALNSGNGNYSGASLTIARNGGANASDSFSFNTTGASFTVSGGNLQSGGQTFATFTNTNGTLTINFTSSGTTATSALADEVFQQIQYTNTSNDPSSPSSSVQLNWSFSDGNSANAQGTGDNPATASGSTTVSVTGVNDEPTLTATGGNPAYVENATASDLYNTVTASTIESGQTFTDLTLTVTNISDGSSEILSFDGSDVALTHGNSVTTTTNSLSVSVSVTGSTATVSFSGATLSAAALQTLVDGLTYRNTSDTPTTGSNRVVTITSIKDSGGTINSGDDTAALSLASTASLTAVNDAPIVANVFTETSSIVVGGGVQNVSGLDDAAVSNADSADYDGGSLTITQGSGTTNGSWGVDGTNVTSGGDATIAAGETVSVGATDIATVHGTNDGQGGNSLQLSFSASATSTNIQTLIQNLTYNAATAAGDRGFTLTLNDNDGTANNGDEDASGSFTISVADIPKITSATYDVSNGKLVVTGTDLQSNGSGDDIDVSKLTLTGEGSETYTLTSSHRYVLKEKFI